MIAAFEVRDRDRRRAARFAVNPDAGARRLRRNLQCAPRDWGGRGHCGRQLHVHRRIAAACDIDVLRSRLRAGADDDGVRAGIERYRQWRLATHGAVDRDGRSRRLRRDGDVSGRASHCSESAARHHPVGHQCALRQNDNGEQRENGVAPVAWLWRRGRDRCGNRLRDPGSAVGLGWERRDPRLLRSFARQEAGVVGLLRFGFELTYHVGRGCRSERLGAPAGQAVFRARGLAMPLLRAQGDPSAKTGRNFPVACYCGLATKQTIRRVSGTSAVHESRMIGRRFPDSLTQTHRIRNGAYDATKAPCFSESFS